MFYYKREQIFIRFLFLSFMGAARKERKIFFRPQREPLSSECERVGGGLIAIVVILIYHFIEIPFFLHHSLGKPQKVLLLMARAIKALPPPPSGLMAIGTFFLVFK